MPRETRRRTSPASGAGERWPASPRGCDSSPTTSRRCCRSRRSSRRSARKSQRDLGDPADPARRDRRHRGPPPRRVRPRVPALPGVRGRWERIAAARRRGSRCRRSTSTGSASCTSSRTATTACPSPARMGDTDIEAHVSEVETKLGAGRELHAARPAAQAARARLPRARPAPTARARASSSPTSGATRSWPRWSSPGASAPATRAASCCPRRDGACLVPEEYEPVVEVLREAGLGGAGTETERYLRIAMLRFLLLQTCDWSDEIVDRLPGEARAPRRRAGHDGPPDPQGDALSALARGSSGPGRGRR